MSQPEQSKRPATYDDLLRVSDHLVAEILDGELVVSPRPAIPHAAASSGIGGDLHGPFHGPPGGPRGPGGWWILDEPELHLGSDVVVPDLAGWRRERLPALRDEPFFTLAPDWVCEVISPRTAGIDRVRKMNIYAREGVVHLWLVDPTARTLEVYRLQAGQWLVAATFAGSERVRVPPFEAIEIEMGRWWLDG
jgi:Uma2 family endonuclease